MLDIFVYNYLKFKMNVKKYYHNILISQFKSVKYSRIIWFFASFRVNLNMKNFNTIINM